MPAQNIHRTRTNTRWWRKDLTAEQASATLKELEKQIDDEIKQMGGRVMIKLNTRSGARLA